MGELNTGATSTVTTCSDSSGSSFFAEQLASTSTQRHKESGQETNRDAGFLLAPSRSLICLTLESTGHCLQRRHCNTITCLRIVISVTCVDVRLLRINNFESRRFTCLVTQIDQSQTFR